jgi:glutamate-5-semialdehyde dehydrogenase
VGVGVGQERMWPAPWMTNLSVVSSRTPMVPRAWSFCVEMPISAPKPSSSPSTKRVLAFTRTAAASTSRVSVCNAAETLLVHRDVRFLPRLLSSLAEAGVTLHGDPSAQAAHDAVVPATDEDWATEYLSMDMAVRVVDDLPQALEHIARWGSGHSEAIVADSAAAIAGFTAGVDAAAVLVNASTRFTDGGEFGFGAEIGISTQKLHARGPLGLPELTSTTYVVTGSGHVR